MRWLNLFFFLTFVSQEAFCTENRDATLVIFECDHSGLLLAKIIHGVTFFEIAYRDEVEPSKQLQAYIQKLQQVSSCSEANASLQDLLKLWTSVGVDFQKEYIESVDGKHQLPRLAEKLRQQLK